MSSKSKLKAKILRLLDSSIQGGLSETTRTCGYKKCACHSDPARRHGPNLYLTFKMPDGRSTGMYIPRTHEKQIRKAVSNWAGLWEALVAYVALNRETLRKKMRKQSLSRQRKGTSS